MRCGPARLGRPKGRGRRVCSLLVQCGRREQPRPASWDGRAASGVSVFLTVGASFFLTSSVGAALTTTSRRSANDSCTMSTAAKPVPPVQLRHVTSPQPLDRPRRIFVPVSTHVLPLGRAHLPREHDDLPPVESCPCVAARPRLGRPGGEADDLGEALDRRCGSATRRTSLRRIESSRMCARSCAASGVSRRSGWVVPGDADADDELPMTRPEGGRLVAVAATAPWA